MSRFVATLAVVVVLVATVTAAGDPYADEYADSAVDKRHPVVRSRTGSVITFDNLREGQVADGAFHPRWATARADLSMLRSAKMLVLTFPVGPLPLGGHAEMLFEFFSGGCRTADGDQLKGLVFSFEAFGKKGVPYKPLTYGISDVYKSIWVVESYRTAQAKVYLNNSKVQVIEMQVPPRDLPRLFEAFMRHAVDKQTLSAEPYHTFRNSCVTNQFRVLAELYPGPGGHTFPSTSRPSKIAGKLQEARLAGRTYVLQVPDEFRAWLDDGTIPPRPDPSSGLTWDDLHSP